MEVLHFHTGSEPLDRYWMTVLGKTEIVFNVMSCFGHVELYLSATVNNPSFQTYHIQIARSPDGKTVIRDSVNGNEMATSSTPDLVECLNYRYTRTLLVTMFFKNTHYYIYINIKVFSVE